jgi:predicted N-acetyltransferase YhbS
VRALTSGDESIAEEACRLFGLEGELDSSAFLARPDALLLVAEDNGEVIGWVYGHELIHPDGERTMLLYALDVAEPARGVGHGSALVGAFVERARQRGCTEVWVLTDDHNPAGIATYAAADGERDPVPQVMFTWKLAEGRHS